MLKPVEQLSSFKYISIQVKVVVADTNRRFVIVPGLLFASLVILVNVYTKTMMTVTFSTSCLTPYPSIIVTT